MDVLNAPVVAQVLGAVSIAAGFGVWLGAAGALISAGVCLIIGGTVAELTSPGDNVEGDADGGPGETD